MFRMFAVVAPILSLALLAGGCCCVGPACQPCGMTCDTSCDAGCGSYDCGGCGDCCEADCCPPCTTCCSMPCVCLPNPLVLVGGLFHKACQCDSGCGEMYWGGWWSDPPCCDPCDPCGNWVGGCGRVCYGDSCGYPNCGPAVNDCYGSPDGQCSDCMQTASIPQDSKVVRRSSNRMITPADIAPRRTPVKAAPSPTKKSPQAMYPYRNQMQR